MTTITDRQLEIVQTLVASKSGEEMDSWCAENGVSHAEFRAAMVGFNEFAKERGLYYNQ